MWHFVTNAAARSVRKQVAFREPPKFDHGLEQTGTPVVTEQKRSARLAAMHGDVTRLADAAGHRSHLLSSHLGSPDVGWGALRARLSAAASSAPWLPKTSHQMRALLPVSPLYLGSVSHASRDQTLAGARVPVQLDKWSRDHDASPPNARVSITAAHH